MNISSVPVDNSANQVILMVSVTLEQYSLLDK